MNLLVICQYYYPEPFRVSDICEELARRGHKVTVVTGEPNYPDGFFYPGYGHGKRADEVINGVKVHRCRIIPRKTGVFFRFLNYFSYPRAAKKYLKKVTADGGAPFDAVFVNQLSPVMMAEPAIAYHKKHGVPVLLYCLDLWPESLIVGGVSRHSALFRVFHKLSHRIYTNVDRILVTSRQFCGYLESAFGIDADSIGYLPQFAEDVFQTQEKQEQRDGLQLLFAGNIGTAQSVDTILNAARQLTDVPVRFHIVGGGTVLTRLQKAAEGLENVVFYGRLPLEEMPPFYAMADAMLVTLQADPVLSMTLPGKVQSYMAAGKPLIAAIDGEAAAVIHEAGCGFCGAAEDADALAANIRRMLAADNRRQMGDNARAYYETHFARQKFMDTLEKELKSL